MSEKIPQRLAWAIETLAVKPDEHLLEIGSGHGVAAALIAEQLATGKLIALDRSDKMTAAASRRNQMHVAAGKVVFQTAALTDADFGSDHFAKIFAVNVNVFWQKPAAELRVIAERLQPDGALYLFYEPPDATQSRDIAARVSANLHAQNFVVQDVIFKDLKPLSGVCIIARQA